MFFLSTALPKDYMGGMLQPATFCTSAAHPSWNRAYFKPWVEHGWYKMLVMGHLISSRYNNRYC